MYILCHNNEIVGRRGDGEKIKIKDKLVEQCKEPKGVSRYSYDKNYEHYGFRHKQMGFKSNRLH